MIQNVRLESPLETQHIDRHRIAALLQQCLFSIRSLGVEQNLPALPCGDSGRPCRSRMQTPIVSAKCPDRSNARRSVSRVLSHLATGMAIHLGRSLPNASRDRPERRRESPPGTVLRPCLPLLLGLAPGGVFPAIAITGDAVRSYRTISPLPRLRGGGWRCVSVALSLGSPPPAVNRHRAFRGARTFLSRCRSTKSGHPTVWHGMVWAEPVVLSKSR